MRNVKSVGRFVSCLWVVAMFVVWFFFRNYPQCIDAHRFVWNAIRNWNNGTLYPSKIDLYDDYITAIGYTNYIQLVHLLLGRVAWIQIINILMNAGIGAEIFYVSRSLFSAKTGYIAVALYCLTTTNLFIPLQLVTEVPFLFLSLSAFSLCVYVSEEHRVTVKSAISSFFLLALAGVIFALAHTVRAVELAFVVPSIILLVFRTLQNQISNEENKDRYGMAMKRAAIMLLPYILTLSAIGFFYKSQTGIFVNGPMTGWHNFVKVSDSDYPIFTGVSNTYDKGGYAFIPSWDRYTFAERDSIYKSKSIHWVHEHPFRFLSVYVRRCVLLWAADYYYIPGLTNSVSYQQEIHKPGQKKALLKMRLLEIAYSAVWYVVLLLCCLGVVLSVKAIIRRRKTNGHQYFSSFLLSDRKFIGWCVLLSVLFLGTAGTCLFPIELRFHYPYNWALTILAAETVVELMSRCHRL